MRKLAKIVLRAIAGTALMTLLAFAGSFETNGTVGVDGKSIDDVQVVEAGIRVLPRIWSKHYDSEGKFDGCLKGKHRDCMVIPAPLGASISVSSEGIHLQ